MSWRSDWGGVETTWIGPFGALVEVRSPQRPLQMKTVRPTSELTLLSGRTVVQRAPGTSRRWTWDFPSGWQEELAALVALEQGVFGPPPWWWYDPMVAYTNMLPPQVASPGLGGDVPDGAVPAGPVEVDGVRHVAAVEGAWVTPTVPVLPGRTYTGSRYGTGTLALRWVDADGVQVDRDQAVTVDGRLVAAGTAPAGTVLALDGTAGTAVSAPDAAPLRIVGDLDVAWYGALANWTSGTRRGLLAKGSQSSNRAFWLEMTTGNRPSLLWFEPDGTARSATATVNLPTLAAWQELGLRVQLDVDNGSGGRTVSFFTSSDGGRSWQQLGSPVVQAGVTSIRAGTGSLWVGQSDPSLRTHGRVRWVTVRDGIGGTPVASPRFVRLPAGTGSFTDVHGNPWTLAGAAAVVESTVTRAAGVLLESDGLAAALQLNEGGLRRWTAGEGMPRVSISGLEQVYQLATEASQRRDVTVELVEVVG
jgi:hypothetical protein